MVEKRYDAVIVGAGAAGLSTALAIAGNGFSVVVLERENTLGGILNQCIHNGFGLHLFKEDLTGPEFAERLVERVLSADHIDFFLQTTASDIQASGEEKTVFTFSRRYGIMKIATGALILAMGCRERNRGNLGIPGTRPSGIFTAGLAQRLVNIEGHLPGRRVIIIGSGDIGLIMARRMRWSGAEVLGVVEIQPYPSGLTRNIVQCLNDFQIPLYLSHIVSAIYGDERVEGVDITPLAAGNPDQSKSVHVACDTILRSVGLVPDNLLSKKIGVDINPETNGPFVDAGLMTCRRGVFACGNVLHVHDLVDFASEESSRCGEHVSEYLRGGQRESQYRCVAGPNVRYLIPNRYYTGRSNTFYLRSLIVKNQVTLTARLNGEEIFSKKIAHVQPSEMISFKLAEETTRRVNSERDNLLEVSLA
jgi:NADPH-dependent 2,4-dienoyl-CoA reductase/sulfur reductase-like enzyme